MSEPRADQDEVARAADEPARPADEPGRPAFEHRPTRRGFIGPFGGRQIVAGIVVVVLAAVLLVAATAPLGNTAQTGGANPQATQYVIDPSVTGLRPGLRAPELAVTRSDGTHVQLTDLDGRPITLAALRGKAVWINFWAHWCPPCQAETPVLRDTYQQYRDRGLVLIGIAVQETNVADVRAYAQTYGLTYPIGFDSGGDIFHLYKVPGLPTQYFIAPDGTIRSVVLGPLDRAGAAAHVEAILPGAGTSVEK